MKLGVNIDHVATLRQARGTKYPDPIAAALLAESAGADNITCHLREDRRHIQDRDVCLLREMVRTSLNFEMAATPAMIRFAREIRPDIVTLVPEKRHELTTEGGLNLERDNKALGAAIADLQSAKIPVSLFIDPELSSVAIADQMGAKAVELHTGAYAEAEVITQRTHEFDRLVKAAEHAFRLGLQVHAGHGLKLSDMVEIKKIVSINSLQIGHAIISRAVMIGLAQAVSEIVEALQ